MQISLNHNKVAIKTKCCFIIVLKRSSKVHYKLILVNIRNTVLVSIKHRPLCYILIQHEFPCTFNYENYSIPLTENAFPLTPVAFLLMEIELAVREIAFPLTEVVFLVKLKITLTFTFYA